MSPSPTSPVLPTGAGPAATIAKSLEIKGEVICSDWLYIDGKVEGSISQPGGRVTVSRDAQVAANISAREVVVLGEVRGNIDASDRVDMRSESSLIGNVITQRISIGDGVFFEGSMEISESTAPSLVAMKLDFVKPFEAHNQAVFTVTPDGSGASQVTWAMSGPAPYFHKVMSVIVNLDRMIGADFEDGLAHLKTIAEGT